LRAHLELYNGAAVHDLDLLVIFFHVILLLLLVGIVLVILLQRFHVATALVQGGCGHVRER
jgi:hypothetical protein